VVDQAYEGYPPSSDLKLASFSGATSVYGSVNPDSDARTLVRDSYAKLGTSQYTISSRTRDDEIKRVAHDKGADIVLVAIRVPQSSQYYAPALVDDNGNLFVLAPYASNNTTAVATGHFQGSPPLPANGADVEYVVTFWRRATTS
jgi:hypothetical protein